MFAYVLKTLFADEAIGVEITVGLGKFVEDMFENDESEEVDVEDSDVHDDDEEDDTVCPCAVKLKSAYSILS